MLHSTLIYELCGTYNAAFNSNILVNGETIAIAAKQGKERVGVTAAL